MIHRECKDRILTECSTAQTVSNFLPQRRFSINMPHKFELRTNKLFKSCDHCSYFIWDRKYLECSLCHTKVHKICEKSLVKACGVDMAQISDILKQIKQIDSINSNGSRMYITTPEPHAHKAPATTENTITSLVTISEENQPKEVGDKLREFTFIKVLGRGNFGKVFLAKHRASEQLFAVKALKKYDLIDSDDVAACFTERDVLVLSLEHPYLTTLFFSFQTKVKNAISAKQLILLKIFFRN